MTCLNLYTGFHPVHKVRSVQRKIEFNATEASAVFIPFIKSGQSNNTSRY